MHLASAALATALWCVLHSALITPDVTKRAQRIFGSVYPFYRLLYNIVSVVTFVLLLWWLGSLPRNVIVVWRPPWSYLLWLTSLSSLVLFIAGARAYDLRHFLGVSQLRRPPAPISGTIPPVSGTIPPVSGTIAASLVTTGILGRVRHPWYTGAILLLLTWSDGTDVSLVMRLTFILYVIIGTRLEERKLVAQYGDVYRTYQRDVPMLFPRMRIPLKS